MVLALKNVFIAMIGAYGLSVTGFLVLRLFIDGQFIAFFNSLVHLLVLPSVILLPLCLLLRQWRLTLFLMPTILAAGIWYSADFLPKDIPTAEETIRVVTYNTLSSRSDFDAVVEAIQQMDGDIVLLQEVGTDFAEALVIELSEVYTENRIVPGSTISGKMMFSRYPIIEYETWSTHFTHQQAQIDVDGQIITVINMHALMPFPNNFDRRNADINALLTRIEAITEPLIIGGDFNMTDLSDPYKLVTDQFQDAYDAVGYGFGFSFILRDIPLARIDYVFYNDHFTAISAEVQHIQTGSDHLPVVVDLAINREPPG